MKLLQDREGSSCYLMKRGSGLALPWEVSLLEAVLLLPQMALLVLFPHLSPSFPKSFDDVFGAASSWELTLNSKGVGGDFREPTQLG